MYHLRGAETFWATVPVRCAVVTVCLGRGGSLFACKLLPFLLPLRAEAAASLSFLRLWTVCPVGLPSLVLVPVLLTASFSLFLGSASCLVERTLMFIAVCCLFGS